MELSPELYEVIVKVVDERVKRIEVTKDDFTSLKNIVRELAEAQKRTDEKVEILAERVNELAEAQKRTDVSIGILESSIKELAEQQKKTDATVKELAEQQKKTDASVRELANAMKGLNKKVESLSENIGFGLEDIARTVLPGYLYRHFNISVDKLKRKFLKVNSEEVEIDLYGVGLKDKKKIFIIGESKSRIYDREVKSFNKMIKKIEKAVKGEIFKVMFGYYVHPSASELAQKENIILVASYER